MNANEYVREIIQRTCLPSTERKRLKIDLKNEIVEALESGESIEDIIERMGDPDEIAAGLYENFTDKSARPFREYKSQQKLFGLPLVHIIRVNHAASGRFAWVVSTSANNLEKYRYLSYSYGGPTARGVFAFGPKAKGIIAVGNLSAGLVSIGNVTAGIISFGNLSVGIFSVANVGLALLVSLGNVALGAMAAGNVVFGYGAAGNVASGKFAIGNEVKGTFTFLITNLSAQREEIKMFIAGLDAPAPIITFFGIIEKTFGAFTNQTTITILIATAVSTFLFLFLMLHIVTNKLLKRREVDL